jgi:hypothetical protein
MLESSVFSLPGMLRRPARTLLTQIKRNFGGSGLR